MSRVALEHNKVGARRLGLGAAALDRVHADNRKAGPATGRGIALIGKRGVKSREQGAKYVRKEDTQREDMNDSKHDYKKGEKRKSRAIRQI